MIGRKHRKYRKLVGDLLYYRSELQFQEGILEKAGGDFDDYQRVFCEQRGVDLRNLVEKNTKRLTSLMEETESMSRNKEEPDSAARRALNKIYKSVALSLHPDRLDNMGLSEEEYRKKESDFKTVAQSMEQGDWGTLIEASEELNIKPKLSKELFRELEKEIEVLKVKIQTNECTYGWRFYNCGIDIKCCDELIKQSLKHLYNLEIT
jgi:hypothetical protein